MPYHVIPKKKPKPHKTYQQQIDIPVSRGMSIKDIKRAKRKLFHIGFMAYQVIGILQERMSLIRIRLTSV